MKYCRVCKLRANDSDTVCAQCGGPVTVFGARPPAKSGAPTTPAGPALTLQGQIQELQTVRQQTLRRTRGLALLCGLVLLLLAVTVYLIYDAAVLSYAVLGDVKAEQDPVFESQVHISFNVVKPGKVVFDRRSGKNRTEKLDVLSGPGPYQLDWSWPSDPQTGIDFNVVYRTGWTRSTVSRHFAMSGKKGSPLDLIFILDITGSMQPFIDGLKKKCIAFADLVGRNGYDIRLGLVAFGDVEINEPITTFEPTADVAVFQKHVGGLQLLNGGDEPESTVEALRKALQIPFRPGAKVCFVHITDASCHHAEKLPDVAEELKRRSITTYVVSQREWHNLYNQLCVHGGRFHAIEDAQFEDILDLVARSIANEIKTRP
jgi:hypothetical protein